MVLQLYFFAPMTKKRRKRQKKGLAYQKKCVIIKVTSILGGFALDKNIETAGAAVAVPKKKSKLPLIVVITIAIILIPIIFIGVIGSVFGIKDDAEVNNATEIISENFDFNDTANLTDAVKEADVHIFEMEQNGAKIQHTYYCNGDIVKTWVQTVTVNLEGTSQDEKEAFVDQCNQEWEDKYSQYTFIEHSVEVVNEELIEIYKFNDVSNHVDDLKELGLIQKNGSVVTLFISYKQTRDMLLA